jgi:hypothetical protein
LRLLLVFLMIMTAVDVQHRLQELQQQEIRLARLPLAVAPLLLLPVGVLHVHLP